MVYGIDGRSPNSPPRLLRPRVNNPGYLRVTNYRNNKAVDYNVHVMVMECYGPPCPGVHGNHKGQYNIHHEDDNKTNNNITNLAWLLHEEHCSHSQKGRDLANDEEWKAAVRRGQDRSRSGTRR